MKFITDYKDIKSGMRLVVQNYNDRDFSGKVYAISKSYGEITISLYDQDHGNHTLECNEDRSLVPEGVMILMTEMDEADFSNLSLSEDWP